jgi:hypothetical protein
MAGDDFVDTQNDPGGDQKEMNQVTKEVLTVWGVGLVVLCLAFALGCWIAKVTS